MNISTIYKKSVIFSKKNFFLLLFFLIQIIVIAAIIYNSFIQPTKYLYVKVKVSQGLWWAATAKPPPWYSGSVKKGDTMYDSFGRMTAEVISVKSYPTWTQNQFDTYLLLKIKTNYNNRTKEYTFNRATVAIGSPINFSFSKSEIAGTIMDLSGNQIQEKYEDKIVTLVNKQGYSKDYPYTYNSLHTHDVYNNGEENVLEILDKSLQKNIWSIANNFTGDVFEKEIESTQNIVLKVKLKVLKKNNVLFYAEEYPLTINTNIPLATSTLTLNDFKIVHVQ